MVGEGNEVFVLDMGKPVRILDVAREFCRLHGLEPDVDVPIVFTGLRPGEKLVEILHYPHEKLVPAAPARVMRTKVQSDESADKLLRMIEDLVEAGDAGDALRYLRARFPLAAMPAAAK